MKAAAISFVTTMLVAGTAWAGPSDTDADAAAGAAEHVRQASELLETQSRQLGDQVSAFLGKIRAA